MSGSSSNVSRIRGVVLLVGGIACLLVGAIWSDHQVFLMAGGALMIVSELAFRRAGKTGES